MNINNNLHALIEEKLQTVYDPEFPMVDIFTLGLIYAITIQEEEKIIKQLTLDLNNAEKFIKKEMEKIEK